jgi:hypothetical protein
MTSIIWVDSVYISLDIKPDPTGRVVRRGDGELFFEYVSGRDAMGDPIWSLSPRGPFREFLMYCGEILVKKPKVFVGKTA